MNLFFALFYGILQGITEFLPISSSAHLAIIQNVFNIDNVEASHMTFNVMLHLGTLAAVFIVYYREIFSLIPGSLSVAKKLCRGRFTLSECDENERFVVFVFVATLPLMLAIPIKDRLEAICSHTDVIGAILIINGLMLLMSDRIKKQNVDIYNQKTNHSLFVGIFQLLATVPGLSRSGTTITAGLLMGFKREHAVKFSFILSIPAILGANAFSFAEMLGSPIPKEYLLPYVAGTVTAAVVGILSIKLLIRMSKKSDFKYFSYYCFAVGIFAMVFG